jgi:glycerol uptake facilitator-like aquaporin
MPTICPIDGETGLCVSTSDKTAPVVLTTVLGTFFFVFIVLLIKTPTHAPSSIPFVNCGIATGAVYAGIGFSHFLGGGVNPAVDLAVIWA